MSRQLLGPTVLLSALFLLVEAAAAPHHGNPPAHQNNPPALKGNPPAHQNNPPTHNGKPPAHTPPVHSGNPPSHNHPSPATPGHNNNVLPGRIHKLHQDLHKLQTDLAAKVVQSKDKFHAELTRFHGSRERLEADLARLHHEKWDDMKKAIDLAKARAIREKYAQQKAALEKQNAPRAAEMARITRQKDSDIARLQARLKTEIDRINPPEHRLEAQRAQLREQERHDLHQLLDPVKMKEIQEKFNPRIAELDHKVQELEHKMRHANERRHEKVAGVEAQLREQLAKLDPPEDRLEHRLERLSAERKAALGEATTAEARKTVLATFDPAIKEMQQKKQSLEKSVEMARTMAKIKIEGIQAIYRNEIMDLDHPEDRMENRAHRLRHEEWTEIARLADPAKVKAIQASFAPRIADLEKKIGTQEADREHLTQKTQAEEARVIAAWRTQMAKIDPPADRLSHQVHLLEEKERAELRSAIDPARETAIRAKFHGRIEELEKKLAERNQEIAQLEAKQRQEMNSLINGFQGKMGPLEQQIGAAMAQLGQGKK